jgi:hypothetical protein
MSKYRQLTCSPIYDEWQGLAMRRLGGEKLSEAEEKRYRELGEQLSVLIPKSRFQIKYLAARLIALAHMGGCDRHHLHAMEDIANEVEANLGGFQRPGGTRGLRSTFKLR